MTLLFILSFFYLSAEDWSEMENVFPATYSSAFNSFKSNLPCLIESAVLWHNYMVKSMEFL